MSITLLLAYKIKTLTSRAETGESVKIENNSTNVEATWKLTQTEILNSLRLSETSPINFTKKIMLSYEIQQFKVGHE